MTVFLLRKPAGLNESFYSNELYSKFQEFQKKTEASSLFYINVFIIYTSVSFYSFTRKNGVYAKMKILNDLHMAFCDTCEHFNFATKLPINCRASYFIVSLNMN